jgi:DUF1680 family protein
LEGDEIWIHQYFSNETVLNPGIPVQVSIDSTLPWYGKVKVLIKPESEQEFHVHLRMPSWHSLSTLEESTASGFDPRRADYETITRCWSSSGDVLEFNFDMSIKSRRAHPKVRGHAGKVAITRGPLVYCLESVDNPGIDIFTARLDPTSLHDEFVPDLLGGCVVIHGKTRDNQPLHFIPYFLWANRGESRMAVWVHVS